MIFSFPKKTDIGLLRIYDILTHQSGLDGWIPFYQKTLRNGQPDTSIYRTEPIPTIPGG